ncbi:MAG TPA: hypothetical protein VF409_11715 [Sphingomonas sp.]
MRRILAAATLATFPLALALPAPAGASGDFGCGQSWRLKHANLSGCDDMAMLGPGNDTRTNLTLLWFDRRGSLPRPGQGTPPQPLGPLFDWRTFAGWLAPRAEDGNIDYSSGEGSRCLSNSSGAAAFEAAVNAAKLPGGEGAALIAARRGLNPDCAKPSDGSAVAALDGQVKSPAGKAFVAYLAGARAFYDGDFDTAASRFAGLAGGRDPWLRETARYMTARVEVNRMQVGLFDEYGIPKDFKTIDQKVVAAADSGLHAYLKDYPKGLYAESAQGLLRRVYWFGGKRDLLARQYVALFVQPAAARGIDDVDLAEEMDSKLLPELTIGDTSDPTLLAVIDLKRMRMADDEVSAGCCTNPITLAEITGQRAAFAGNQPLFDYLVAAHQFYVGNKPAEVLKLIPDAARQKSFSDIQFSRQMLRGMALEAMGDRNARGFWLEMMPGATLEAQHSALELALAYHDERTGGLARVFAADSPVDDASIRGILLTNVADAALLRQQAKGAKAAHERQLALFTLLYKELSRGAYRDFGSDLALVPAGAPNTANFYDLLTSDPLPLGIFVRPPQGADIDCPALRRTAADLAAAPASPHARLCLADFFRANGFDQFALDTQPPKQDLGGTKTLFAGPVYSRLEVYKSIIADPKAGADDKAYALYRAVNCYAPSGNNSCGGTDVATAQRKAWFQRLKADYPKSRWASDLRYYW